MTEPAAVRLDLLDFLTRDRPRTCAEAQALRRVDWHSLLTVHLPCAQVRGLTLHGVQGCPCAPTPKWEGCDVSRAVDLCVVCARGTAGGVTRWSWLGCTSCRSVEKALQGWLGMGVLPLGRHSIMNGIGLRVTEATSEEVDAFAVQFEGLTVGWQQMSVWGRAEVGRLADALPDTGPDAPLELWQRTFSPSWAASVDAYERLLETPLPPTLGPSRAGGRGGA